MRRDEKQDLLGSIDAYVQGLFAPSDPALEKTPSGARARPGRRRYGSPRARGSSRRSSRGSRGRGASWRSGRSASTARSTSPGRCPQTGA